MFHLHRGDCLQTLRKMPAESVDSIVTDPPYGMNFQSTMVARERRKAKIAGDERPFIWWLAEAHRVLRDGGAMVCFTDWRNQETWRLAIECAGFHIRSHCVWDRVGHGMGDLTGAFAPRHDVFWFATKGKFKFPGKRPASVLRHTRPAASCSSHPTRKPVELMSDLVRAVTPPGGIVLDPFAGSGSTGEAAVLGGYRFIGCELSDEYASEAQWRIESALAQVRVPA